MSNLYLTQIVKLYNSTYITLSTMMWRYNMSGVFVQPTFCLVPLTEQTNTYYSLYLNTSYLVLNVCTGVCAS